MFFFAVDKQLLKPAFFGVSLLRATAARCIMWLNWH